MRAVSISRRPAAKELKSAEPFLYKIQPTYDINESFVWNLRNGPLFKDDPNSLPKREIKSKHKFLNFELNSRLGIPAGLLLNSKWVRLYSDLGFDILTYKTVRTEQNQSHSYPNCLFLDLRRQIRQEELNKKIIFSPNYSPKSIQEISITNSFGVPSSHPEEWQHDVRQAKQALDEGQILIVSVVGTFAESSNTEDFISDFVHCAVLAKQAGADIVELNFSCPNSPSSEGNIYSNPQLSSRISKMVRNQIGSTPLFIKLGYFSDFNLLEQVINKNAPYIQGIVAINTLKMSIVDADNKPALPGEGRESSGVCGAAVKELGLRTVAQLLNLRKKYCYDFKIVGVGGIMTPDDAAQYLNLGVDAIQSCTGAMFDPYLAYKTHNCFNDTGWQL